VSDELAERYAAFLASHPVLVFVGVLVLTAIVGAGAVVGENPEGGGIGQFETESEARDAANVIERDYPSDDAVVAQVVVRGDDPLSKASLVEGLRVQREMRDDPAISETLREERAIVGFENVVATAAYYEDQAGEGPPPAPPTLDEQIAALESRSEEEVAALVDRVLDPDASAPGAGDAGADPYQFLPSSYERGDATADARITFVFQVDDSTGEGDPEAAWDAQLAIETLVEDRFDDAFVFGQGIVDDASTRAFGDSFAIITPVALVLVLLALGFAYRDLVDVLVSILGIATVLVWLAGVQGWLAIPSSQLLIAVPFLLIGLSIDYSLHVVMRYREAREGDLRTDDGAVDRRDPTTATRLGVAGVVFALGAATVSTGIGFLSNVVSPLPAIQDFAVLCAAGILATFVVFGALVPALKLGVERGLTRVGFEREQSAVGLDPGFLNGALTRLVALSRRAPLAVVVVALLLGSAGAYGATGIDTEFNRADFLPQDAPDWAKTTLPDAIAPGDYDVRENVAYLGDNFRQRGDGSQAEVLLRDGVTDPATLAALDDASATVDGDGSVVVRSDGTAAVDGPHTLLRTLAAENDTVAAAIADRDDDGDGLPDRDVAAVYDLAYDVAPERASETLARDADGAYTSARLVVGVAGDASAQSVAADVRAFADSVEVNAPTTAVATGGPVVTAVLQDALLETLVEAFAVTLAVILTFLVGIYWWRHGVPDLGALALVPVVVALAWLLGTMRVFGIAFNSETAVITSLAIGLGADYAIHLSERIVEERRRHETLDDALVAAVTGTGGALVGSAVTTASGFGVLALALTPPLQRFGLVTGLAIAYAFVACIVLLPSLVVLRERYLVPRITPEPAVGDD
jgi:predicted RND superfamily exporter protein